MLQAQVQCPNCHASAPPHARICSQCGGPLPYPAAAPQPYRPSQGKRPWARFAILVPLACIGPCLLGLIFWIFSATRDIDSSDGPFRVPQRDVRGREPGTGALLVRCSLCDGSGSSPHFARRYQTEGLADYYVDRYIPCPACNATSTMRTSNLRGRAVVVPDSEPDSYVR